MSLMKRGITPLVATVLLIAFAIAFGAFAMTVGRNLDSVPEQANITSICESLDFDFLKIEGNPYVCLEDNKVNLIAVNKGSQRIESLQLIIVGESVNIENVEGPLEPHSNIERQVIYNQEKVGKVKELQFIPRVTPPGSDTPTLCIHDPFVVEPRNC